jgi:hypothetical protein
MTAEEKASWRKIKDSLKGCISCGGSVCICRTGSYAAHCWNCNRNPNGFIGAYGAYESKEEAAEAWNDQDNWIDPHDCVDNDQDSLDSWTERIKLTAKERLDWRRSMKEKAKENE